MKKMTKWILASVITMAVILVAVLAVRNYHSMFWGFETVIIHNGEMTQTLPESEAKEVIRILNSKEYTPGQGGCPFGDDLTITVGDTVFALSQDGCHGVKEMEHERYYTLSRQEWNFLNTIFIKYGAKLL